MKKRTAKTVDQVRAWIESTPFHVAEVTGNKIEEDGTFTYTHMIMRGHFEQLRVPVAIWDQCHIKSSGSANFDARMYRWDFEKEKAILFGEYVEPQKARVQINGYVVWHYSHAMCYDKNGRYRGQQQENIDGPDEIFIDCLIREGKPAVAVNGPGVQSGWEHVPDLTSEEMRLARQ